MHLIKPIFLVNLLLASMSCHAGIEIVRYSAPNSTAAIDQTNAESVQPVIANIDRAQVQETVSLSINNNQFKPPLIATLETEQNKPLFNAPIQISRNKIPLRNPPRYVGCFYSSSKKYGIPVDILMAIAQTESSFNPNIRGKLGYGSDHGLMQINDWWIPKLKARFNISLSDIYDPCTNIEVASWILAHNFNQYGYSWRAIGAYNAVTEYKRVRYINKVYSNLNKLHQGLL